MTASEAASLWQALRAARPLAAQLALLTCLPVRVTPSLLRLARLKLLPHAGTGEEADLWLSELVESRSTFGFSYRRAVREHLRNELTRDTTQLVAVWNQVHLAQAAWQTPRARLEEELTWRLLRDRSDREIERHWQAVLQTLDAGPDAEGLARWVMRAVPDLPEGALDSVAGQRVWQGANLMLGDAGVLGEVTQTFLATSDFAFATRRLPRRSVQVGLLADGGLVSPLQTIENGHAIDVPATRPLWLQLEDDAGTPLQVLTLPAGEPVQWFTNRPATVIRAIDGAAYRLAPPQASPVPEKKLAGNRVPRVHIEYDVELYGAETKVQLPFVIGVMADLSGRPSEPRPAVAVRRFLEIDCENFDAHMKGQRPRVAFQVTNYPTGEKNLAVDLEFERLDDFLPLTVLHRVRPLRLMLRAREHLADLPAYLESRPEVRDLLTAAFQGRTGLRTLDTAIVSTDEVGRRRIVLDDCLSGQLGLVMHHPDFERLETAWRGLHHLVHRIDTGQMLKIRFLNLTKQELADALRPTGSGAEEGNSADTREQSTLFKKVYDEQYGQFGGEPFGLLVGDYHFDHSAGDVALLQDMARLAATAHAPFLAGASPALMQMESWQQLNQGRDYSKTFALSEYRDWQRFRASDNARSVGLAMPGFLAREPYSADATAVQTFEFVEKIEANAYGDNDGRIWANAAYAMATNIGRAFSEYGWCARICGVESGGLVEGLPLWVSPAAPNIAGSVEGPVTDRLEAELSRLGLMPLVQLHTGMAAFLSANSMHQPADSENLAFNAAARLGATWPYLLACNRFVHYLKCIVRDKIGGFKDDTQTARLLREWLLNYVYEDYEAGSQEIRCLRPLGGVDLVLRDSRPVPGTLDLHVFLRPHYQLAGLDMPLELVTRLPSYTSR